VKKTLVSFARQQLLLNHQLTVHNINITALKPTATALDRKTTAVRILLPTALTTFM
jgi:hypothetical protein